MHVKVLSNQASKQPEIIKNILKMQRVLFHKSHDIENMLLLIIHVDKMCSKGDNFFLNKTSSFFLSLHFESNKNRRSPHDIPSPTVISLTQEQIISFPRKKLTKELQDFKSKLF
jgi:hypothetical protein